MKNRFYCIDLFGKRRGFYGLCVDDAIEFADQMTEILSFNDIEKAVFDLGNESVVRILYKGDVVAEQKWEKDYDNCGGYWGACDWEKSEDLGE